MRTFGSTNHTPESEETSSPWTEEQGDSTAVTDDEATDGVYVGARSRIVTVASRQRF